MTDYSVPQSAHAEAIANLKQSENLRILEQYLDRKSTILGVYPQIEYACVVATHLRVKQKDIEIGTYHIGDGFDQNYFEEGRKILVVKESLSTNGTDTIGQNAADAIKKYSLNRDNFRLLIVSPWRLFTLEEIYPELNSKHEK